MRQDISHSLVHFTKPTESESAYDVLRRIIRERRILGSNRFVRGGMPSASIHWSYVTVTTQQPPARHRPVRLTLALQSLIQTASQGSGIDPRTGNGAEACRAAAGGNVLLCQAYGGQPSHFGSWNSTPMSPNARLCRGSGAAFFFPPRKEEWWTLLDSNQRPLPCQGSALTN